MTVNRKGKEDGLNHDIVIAVNENSLLMDFLIKNLRDKSRDNVKSLLRYHQIRVNGSPVSQYNHHLLKGQQITISAFRNKKGGEKIPNIVFEDAHLIVIEKEHGVLSISTGSGEETAYSMLSAYVKKQHPAAKIYVIHRLDRDTSGLMMYAKSENVQGLLQRNWHNAVIERTYMAWVEGEVGNPEGEIRSYLFEDKNFVMHSTSDPAKGELAVTRFKTLQKGNHYSLLKVDLLTGKKNQIRVHMREMGHPIAGDRKYGASTNPAGRLCLHASVLAFRHPVTLKDMRFVSDQAPGFKRLLKG